jgi:RNA polymerase sigma-70 factor (ECF subfamily)
MDTEHLYNYDAPDASVYTIRNNDAAFELFFKAHFKPLCAWCQYKFGFDTSIAKEVVHTAFIKLWKARASLEPGIPVKAWLNRIIINTSLDILKHSKIREKYKQYVLQRHAATGLTEQVESFDTKKLSADIDKAIAELPGQMRTIFELSRYDGLKYAEIAHQLNISVNTVETQMSRALKKLRVKLAAWLPLYFIIMIQFTEFAPHRHIRHGVTTISPKIP